MISYRKVPRHLPVRDQTGKKPGETNASPITNRRRVCPRHRHLDATSRCTNQHPLYSAPYDRAPYLSDRVETRYSPVLAISIGQRNGLLSEVLRQFGL